MISECSDVLPHIPMQYIDIASVARTVGEPVFRSGCGSEHAPFNGRLCAELALCERGFLNFYALNRNENKPKYASTCVLAITNVNMSKIQVFNCATKLFPRVFLTQFDDSIDKISTQITSFYI